MIPKFTKQSFCDPTAMDSLDRLQSKVEKEVDRPYRNLLKDLIQDADRSMSSKDKAKRCETSPHVHRTRPRIPRASPKRRGSPGRRTQRQRQRHQEDTMMASAMEIARPKTTASLATGRNLDGEFTQTLAASMARPPSRPSSQGRLVGAGGLVVSRRPSTSSAISFTESGVGVGGSNELVWIARAQKLSLDTCKQAWELFKPHATLDGEITKAQFAKIFCAVMGVRTERDLPADISDKAMYLAFKEKSATITFSDFVAWYSSWSFDEHFTLTSEEKDIRSLAKKYNITAVDIDRYRLNFDDCDTDGGGTIGESEFEGLLRKCAKVPAHVEIPAARFRQLWKECDSDGSGEVDFEEFIQFYRRYFDDQGQNLGFEGYYRSVRPVHVHS